MRPSVQIFAGVLMQAAAGRLELSATDMELSLRTCARGGCRTGRAAPSYRAGCSADIVRQLPADEVEIEYQAEENTLLVTSGSASYRLRTYAVEDFPRLPEVEGVPTSTLDAEPLLEAIACVGRAAGRDESRPVLTGVLRAAGVRQARDGRHGLIPAVGEGDRARRRTRRSWRRSFPARALDELRRIAGGGGQIELALLDNHVAFGCDGVWLTTRKIDGQFPDHTKLIPETG